LFETLAEETECPENIHAYCKRLNGLLKDHFSDKDVEEELLELRKELTYEVEVLTSYADCFQIYEYVLNRIERRFKTLPEVPLNDEAFIKRLMSFLTDARENRVINGRIKEIVGQLPIRLTKQKFFSLVMEGLSVYIGSPRENLQDMMYTLRTESMVELPKDMDKGYQGFYELLKGFHDMDYRNINKEGYEDAISKLSAASSGLVSESGLYVMLQEIINDFCVLLFARTEAVIDVKEEDFYSSMIMDILDKFAQEDDSITNDDFFDRLTQLEGRQETFYNHYLKIELPEESAQLNKDPDYIKSVNVDRLLSGSRFVELRKCKDDMEPEITGEEPLTDRSYLLEVTESYFKELEKVFKETSKPVVRAIMAKVLSDLPIYFNSIEEIQSYIRGSLDSCIDQAEKETCKELLEELMDDENNLV
jgi:hypothetical protein